jgi:Tfp pilus assembly protein FimT
MKQTVPSSRGFTLVELMIVVAFLITIIAIAVPSFHLTDTVRLNAATREVERELQTARLKAVTVNRPLQVRFNCPAPGQYRIVEGGALWPEANRCSTAVYPYPPPANAAYQMPPMPQHDGPVRYVNSLVTLSSGDPSLVLQFSPDGRVSQMVGGVSQAINNVPVTLMYGTLTRTVNVNALGRVQIQ